MKYVYLVYEDLNGLQGIYATPSGAEALIREIDFNQYDLPKDTPLDYDDGDQWGWDGIAWWVREEVIE